MKQIKILVGINVDQMFAEAHRKGLMFFGDETKTKEEFLNWFVQDIREAKYAKDVEDGILQFVQDLIDGRIEVRAHTSKTLHAKFYLFLPEHHSPHSDGWVIMGSSNLTEAGLGIKQSPNYELNVALKDYDDVHFAKQEFEKLWEEATPILPTDIQQFKQKTHIGQTFTPFELYIKLLIEYFGKNIDYDPDSVGDLPKSYKKLSYQIDAVNQGFQMLMEHNGFFLSDVVGLGKTVVAAMIAKRFLIANGSLNTKILVVYPPALESNWKSTFRQFNIDRHTKFITNGRLDRILDGGDPDYWPKEDYDLIIVDEAHRYRSHTSQAFQLLQRICKTPRANEGLIPGRKKKVILISATPLNNRPQDLYYQLQLFQDTRLSTLPETNLQSFFGPIIREFREITRQETPDINRIRELYRLIRERVIAPITVRRTRRDLKNYPKYLEDLMVQGIVFPEIAPPIAKIYQLDTKINKLFYQTLFYLTDNKKIQYFRYQAIRFLLPHIRQEHYPQGVLVSKSLAGIIKTFMVKRLESSFRAFKTSLSNLATATQRMIEMFEAGKVIIAPEMNINEMMNKGKTLDEIEEIIHTLNDGNTEGFIFKPQDFEPQFFQGLVEDYNLLNELIQSWNEINYDPKLETFLTCLRDEFLHHKKNPTGKLVIFTESAETATYLAEKIEEYLKTKVLNITSENRNRLFETIRENFDANYEGKQKNDYNIIITTDVLAEGINLHRANVIINYDTPWNATRLMQRIGRVNRIGSVARVIYNYNFYPSQQGDEEIRLYNNALIKLQAFHSAFGEDAQIFSHEEMLEQFRLFKDGLPDEEDKRLHYLQFIREFKDNNPEQFKRIKTMPIKARTSRSNAYAQKKNITPESTIAFLKSPYKSEFYLIKADKKVLPLTFLEAAEIFEAQATEPAYPVPPKHYEHVQAALECFEREFLTNPTIGVSGTDRADGDTKQALKFLRDFVNITQNSSVTEAIQALSPLVEAGTYTSLAKELKILNRRYFKKKEFTLVQTEQQLLSVAKRYDIGAINTDDTPHHTYSSDLKLGTPEVILSETFIP
ncbi:MAG: helicase-related protein [Chitinophagales bacterium]|nr:helicase-related protein [Chitinophagales bacterium]